MLIHIVRHGKDFYVHLGTSLLNQQELGTRKPCDIFIVNIFI